MGIGRTSAQNFHVTGIGGSHHPWVWDAAFGDHVDRVLIIAEHAVL